MMRWVAFGIAALVVGGCNASDSSAAPATSGVSATTSGAATTPVPTSTTPTSTSTTIEVTTTLPATTTTVATEDLIKQAVQDYAAAYHLCGVSPATCLPETFTAEQGRSRSTLVSLATAMAEQGLYFAVDSRGSYQVEVSVTMISSTEATATYCAHDGGVVMGPNGPDGQPTVVNDEILNLRNEYVLFLEGGSWRVGEQLQQESLQDGSVCPPAE